MYICCRCSSFSRSYLYNDMFSHLSHLKQLQLVDCKFHDISKNAFRGLSSLDVLSIDGANLLGHIDSMFTSHLFNLLSLSITRSRLSILPALCNSTGLRSLNLSNNNIADVKHCGIFCVWQHLRSLEILDINNNHITSLPDWLGDSTPDLLRVSAGHNKISEVNNNLCRKLYQLKYLDLKNNSFKESGYLQLSNCSKIVILDLSGNSDLGSISPQSIRSMTYIRSLILSNMDLKDDVWDKIYDMNVLEVLHLQHNSLSTVPPDVMRKFFKLQFLNLSHNSIRVLHFTVFNNQSLLKILDLSSNGIVYLPPFIFDKLHNLEQLYLADNNISLLPISVFRRLYNLKKLNLRNNEISSFPLEGFSSMSNLKYLDLSDNNLDSIGENFFSYVPSLVIINLSGNRLITLPVMSPLLQLAYVNLGHNNLTLLQPSMFTGLKNLTSVIVSGNRLVTLSSRTLQAASA